MKFEKALDNIDRSLLQNMDVILSGPTVIKLVRVHRVRGTRNDFSANFGDFFRCGHSGRSAIVVAQNIVDPITMNRHKHRAAPTVIFAMLSEPGSGLSDSHHGFVASLSLGVMTSANGANVIQGTFSCSCHPPFAPALIGLTVTGAVLTTAYADSGYIRFNVIKAGFVVGGSGGSGTLVFQGRSYPLSIGGVSYGFTFGASATDFVGTASNIRSPCAVNGVYGAAGAGVAVGPGAGGSY